MEPPLTARPSGEYATSYGPIPLFDVHCRYLGDSYLSFFLERKRIEEVYTESLLRLHRKIKTVDAYLDDRGDITSMRSAWGDFRDNTEREAQARQAFLAILSDEIIKPLVAFKDTQERTRKRIKEDLKNSGTAYHEYAEMALPKLKSRYLKRFMDSEDQRKAPLVPTSPMPDSNFTNVKPNPGGNRISVTSPQPLRSIDRRPSLPHPGGRSRSPSSTTAFSDLAHQGKRQLNSLIGFLDKGGSVKDSLGGQNNQALRTVRAKRELDEADKEYRQGVHWLETLRLRRIKTLESGYTSLTTLVAETSVLMKSVLEKYTDNMTATTTTETQLFTHARGLVKRISPENDVKRVTTSISISSASAIPDPILYQHCVVGECNDLIFGISLVDYSVAKNLPEGRIPRIVQLCIDEIDKRGLESEGIYRVSGRHANVQALQHAIEKDEASFQFSPQHDIFCVASLLKLYLRELPEPVFKFSLQDRVQHTEDFNEHFANNFALLKHKIRRLQPVHQATLKAILEHLARVNARREKNKMDSKNLAIVFGSVIFGEDELPKAGELLSMQNWKDTLMEDLINHARVIFNPNAQDLPHPNSPPLPPTPAGEPVPQVTYGSRSTRIANLSVTAPPPEDFTPRLPSRPANSIHPSARANPPSSPTKERMDQRRIPDPDSPLSVESADWQTVSEDALRSPPPSSSGSVTPSVTARPLPLTPLLRTEALAAASPGIAEQVRRESGRFD